jgi:hypothetical protein
MQKRYTIPKPPHGSQEWLNARWKNSEGQARITASIAAVVHLENQYTTPEDLAAELLALYPPVPKEQNDAMRRGTMFEPVVAHIASLDLNVTITEPQELYCYEEDGVRLMATMDGKDLSGNFYEIKTTNKRWDGKLPRSWYWQGVQQAICTDATEIIWAIMDSTLQINYYTQAVTSDERQQHIDAVRKFLGFIDMGMMPEGSVPTYQNAATIYPEGYENTVALSDDVYNTLERLAIAKEQIKSAEAVRDQLQGELGMMLGDAEYGSIDGVQVVTWKNSSRTSFDAKQFEKEHPALHAKFKKTSTFRTMRITAKESK